MTIGSTVISHGFKENLDEIAVSISKNDKKVFSTQKTLEIFSKLQKFELGKYILENKGLNAYATQQIIFPKEKHLISNDIEYFLLYQSPVVLATRERFDVFQRESTKIVADYKKLASIPCGLMDDLLGLNYRGVKELSIVGVDLDFESLHLAAKNIAGYAHRDIYIDLVQRDAFNLNCLEQFDLICSNGLNIYEPSRFRLLQLYRQFYKALKNGGKLITSFLTPPPTAAADSPWQNFNLEHVMLDKAIFADIIGAKFLNFCSAESFTELLNESGFKNMEIIYDKQKIFPTAVAWK